MTSFDIPPQIIDNTEKHNIKTTHGYLPSKQPIQLSNRTTMTPAKRKYSLRSSDTNEPQRIVCVRYS